ncbi:MAG: phosphatase PAP2 family protein [Acidimicrobiia bacterium]|nr:phosphatase PAP2 family protein [Acidimicrobiia bacterium]
MERDGIDQRRPAFLGHRRVDARLTLAAGVGFTLLAVLVAVPAGRAWVQEVDDVWNAWMWALEVPILVGFARFLAYVGSSIVMTPVGVGVAVLLVVRRRYAALVGWVVAITLSEVTVLLAKPAFDRVRPPGQLVMTTRAAFPSGHVTAATTFALALVLIFTAPGSRRVPWKVVAIAYIGLMAWSRTYLHAHWLSDVIGGALLGTLAAVGTFLVVDAWARHASSSSPAEASSSASSSPAEASSSASTSSASSDSASASGASSGSDV